MTYIKLDKAVLKRIEEARELLREAATEIQGLGYELAEVVTYARGEWGERSERWQEGDRGTNASNWIDEIETLADRLQQHGTDGLELVDDLVDVNEKPEEVW